MHNGQPSMTSATVGDFQFTPVIVYHPGRVEIQLGHLGTSFVIYDDLQTERGFERARERMRRKRLQLELDRRRARASKLGRSRTPHFPSMCRASLPEASEHVAPSAVVPVEWDRAMRARWLR